MGFKIPAGIKEPIEKLPTGYIMFNIDKITEGDLGKEGDPVYGFLADLTAEEPSEVTGITKEERFYLGIRPTDKRVQNGRAEADPMCEKEDTLKATLGRFNNGKHQQTPLTLTSVTSLSDAQTHTAAFAEVVKAHDALAGVAADTTYPDYDPENFTPACPGHTNTPINMSRWLIQRLVTSNPSAGYIFRVQKRYRETNGNLGAVVKAILLDYEARSLQLADNAFSHGKVKEPLIHFAHLLRLFKAYSGLRWRI